MTRRITFFIFLLFSVAVTFAQQVPYGFNYQSIARDQMGLPIVNTAVNLRISVYKTTANGTLEYQETQSATTNQFGLVNLVIGKGTVVNGTFSGINWSSDKHFIQVEVNNGGTFTSIGVTEFQSVPYALASDNALKIQGSNIDPVSPSDGQILKFIVDSVTGLGKWVPTNPAAVSGGTVTSVLGADPIFITGNPGVVPTINIYQANSTASGYISFSDWESFNNKLSTTSGFSGDVSGTYNSLQVNSIGGIPISLSSAPTGAVLSFNGTGFVPALLPVSNAVTSISGSGIAVVTTTAGGVYNISVDGSSFVSTLLGQGIAVVTPVAGGYAVSVDGSGFVNTLAGASSNVLISPIAGGYSVSVAGLTQTTPSIVGINSISVTTGNGFDFTVSGQNLVAGNGISLITAPGFVTITGTSADQWTSNTPAIYTNSYVGIGTANPMNQLHVVSPNVATAAFITASNTDNSKFINLYSGTSGTDFSGIGYSAAHGFEIGSLSNPTNTGTYFTRFRIDPGTGNVGVGLGASTNAVEKLTVQGNSSVSGIVFASGFRSNTLSLLGIGSGILTVDGLGNVTTTSLVINNVFTPTVGGTSFTNDNIIIQGTTTSGVAKLKVRGDLSAGGQVIASQTLNPTGTASTTVTGAILFKQRIYIPQGTNSLNASLNAYEFVGTGANGVVSIYINGSQVGTATFSAANDINTTLDISNIPVSGLTGFQNLEIRARAGNTNDGVILQGYTLVIND
jgi:hypothetical protein